MRKRCSPSYFLFAILLGFVILSPSAHAQTTAAYEWTWMGGPDTTNAPGVYPASPGSSTASTTNIPGSRYGAVSWTDKNRNLWLFGGQGYDSVGNEGYLNDLWEFNSSTGEWAWLGGSNTVPPSGIGSLGGTRGEPGAYGTFQTFSAGNIPGGRINAASWIDNSGNLWLFGGQGYDSAVNFGDLNDLWEFNPTLGPSGEWAWMGGSSLMSCAYFTCTFASGVYGQKGAFSGANFPGSRVNAVSWTDKNGNFWLFGGQVNPGGSSTDLNDLWEFNPTLGTAGEWAWMSGSSSGWANGTYGTLGQPGGVPGARQSAAGWTDNSGNLWLFGGNGIDSSSYLSWEGQSGDLNDLWEYNRTTSQWTWMGGGGQFVDDDNIRGSYAVYGTLGQPAASNVPGGRYGMTAWKDSSGDFWLFGGQGYSAVNSIDQEGLFNDLWEYNPTTGEWTWMGGQSTINCTGDCVLPGVFGTLLTPAFANNPAGRVGAVGWTDKSGNLWLFGGASYYYGDEFPVDPFNDLWESQSTTDTRPVTPAPTFSPAAGTYTSQQSVTISDTAPNTTIYISNSGAPTNASTIYNGAVTVASSQTLQAVAQRINYALSPVSTATYTLNMPVVATPVFSVVGVSSDGSQQYLSLSDTTPRAQILCTNGPLTPYTSWGSCMAFGGYGTITSGQTVYAIAEENGYADSAIASVTFPVTFPAAATPTFNVTSGTYTTIQSVTISDATPGSSIYYTIDGSTPVICYAPSCGTDPILYTGLVTVPETMTIKAIADAPGYTYGAVSSASYTFNPTNFGDVKIGSSATAYVIVVIPNAAIPSTISVVTEGAVNQDFTNAGSGTCTIGASYTAMSACTVNVSFAPYYASARYGAAILYDASGKVIGTGYVQGTGQGPQISFTSSTIQPSIAANGFTKPFGMTADTNGNFFVNDSLDSTQDNEYLYKETLQPNGTYLQSTITPQMGYVGSAMTVDGAGNVYDAAAYYGTPGSAIDGVGVEIPTPSGGYSPGSAISGAEAVDGAGNLYTVSQQYLYQPGDNGSNYLSGETLKQILLPPSSPGGGMWPVPFNDVAVDGSGNVYTTAVIPPNVDEPASCWVGNSQVCYYEAVGEQFSGANPPASGGLSFNGLLGDYGYSTFIIAVDRVGDAYFTAQAPGNGPNSIQQAYVERAALQPDGTYRYAPIGSGWVNPTALATDGLGNAYVLDAGAKPSPAVYKFDFADQSALSFANTGVNSTSADSPQTVTVTNYGNLPLLFSGITVPADFSLNNSVANACTASTSLAALQTCVLSISFTPVTPLSGTQPIALNESIGVISNTLNTASTTSTIKVSGTEILPVAATPTFSLATGTYTPGQSVTISDTTPDATIYYTTNGTAPATTSSTYAGAITVSSTETLEAIAAATGYTNSAVASAAYTIATNHAATPTFSDTPGAYTTTQTVSISDATSNAIIYYTTNGTVPATTSSIYAGAITVSSTETLEAIAAAAGYTNSAVATGAYTITLSNPAPVINSLSPAFTSAGSAAFTLTVNGSGFTSQSTVYWGTSALTTTYASASKLTAPVSAAEIASVGLTPITVQTPTPGGGTSYSFQFEVDSADSSATPPSFTGTTATVAAGSTASYSLTMPSTVESATVSCLNLPTGAACNYSSTNDTLTITTSSNTPKDTYLVTVAFTETVSGAATSWILLPFLLLPLVFLRKRMASQGAWLTAFLGVALLAAMVFTGCGSGGSSYTQPPPPQTHQVTSSSVVTLTVQ